MVYRLLARAVLAAVLAAGCGSYPPLPQVVVHPGESIQAALLRMPANADSWAVLVKRGVYHQTVLVDRAGVSLIGEITGDGPDDRPILEGTVAGGRLLQDAVIVSGAHFTMQGFTVRNYSGSGVTTSKTHDIILRDILADHTGRYGLAPVESEDILIDSCIATGLSDAGIHVGASRRATVQSCLVFNNVVGIAIENTVDALVQGNESFANTAGLLAVVRANQPSPLGQNCTVRDNNLHDNNHSGDPNALVAKVPAGVGVAVMAADGTVIENNRLTGNHSAGVAIVGLGWLGAVPTGSDVDPDPDATILRRNSYAGNGKDPDPALPGHGFPAGGDILWDGKGKGNCIDEPQGNNLVKVGAANTLSVCN